MSRQQQNASAFSDSSSPAARLVNGRLGVRAKTQCTDWTIVWKPGSRRHIHQSNADGTNQRALTDNKDEDGTPAWQPSLSRK